MSLPPHYTPTPVDRSADPMGIYDADTSDDEREVAGEQQEQDGSESEKEDDEEENVKEERDQTRICTVCFNLKLFVEPINDPSAAFVRVAPNMSCTKKSCGIASCQNASSS